jgi:hypothetical protein
MFLWFWGADLQALDGDVGQTEYRHGGGVVWELLIREDFSERGKTHSSHGS